MDAIDILLAEGHADAVAALACQLATLDPARRHAAAFTGLAAIVQAGPPEGWDALTIQGRVNYLGHAARCLQPDDA